METQILTPKMNTFLIKSVKNYFSERKKYRKKKKGYPMITLIIIIVSNYYNITMEEMLESKKKSRKREIVKARQTSHWFAKKLTTHTLRIIGEQMGAKSHDTVLFSCKQVNNLMDTDLKYFKEIQEITDIINSRS